MRDKREKPKVHISTEIWYRGVDPVVNICLCPGQAVPVGFDPPGTIHPPEPEGLSCTEMKSYVSLWDDEKVYTDAYASPLHPDYLKREHMTVNTYCHSIKDGFGVTTYDVSWSKVQGIFSKKERRISSYTIEKLLIHEKDARYVAGPACFMYLIPEIYAKLTDKATPMEGDVQFYDIFFKEVAWFRRLFMPVVLGAYDGPGHKADWQKLLLEEERDPDNMRHERFYLRTRLQDLSDYKTGHSYWKKTFWGDVKKDPEAPYYTTCWYLAYPLNVAPNPVLVSSPPSPRMIFIAPYVKGDALAPIDIGRKRLHDWEEKFEAIGRGGED